MELIATEYPATGDAEMTPVEATFSGVAEGTESINIGTVVVPGGREGSVKVVDTEPFWTGAAPREIGGLVPSVTGTLVPVNPVPNTVTPEPTTALVGYSLTT
jgi:hypothetical protein